MYELVWVRSLSLIYGGTHLAVTDVLSVFMGGAGPRQLRYRHTRRCGAKTAEGLDGYLKIGIALSTLTFIALMKIYPVAYIPLAQGMDDHRIYVILIRILFACLAMIIPTTLMGGTLPVLTRFASRHSSTIGTPLSLLYGLNTLGAVAGSAAAGFFLLRYYSVSDAILTAIAINFLIGLAGVLLPDRTEGDPGPTKQEVRTFRNGQRRSCRKPAARQRRAGISPVREAGPLRHRCQRILRPRV